MTAFLGTLLLVGVRTSQAVVAEGATPGALTLQLWPAGQGRIDVAQNGAPVGSCDFVYVIARQSACNVQISSSAPVTLTASAEPGAQLPFPDEQAALPDFPVAHPSFVRWTLSECPGTGPCTFTPEGDSDWVGAIFTPLQLQIGIGDDTDDRVDPVGVLDADGQVNALPCGGTDFLGGTSGCHGVFPADSSVVLVPSGDPAEWGAGCDSITADPPRCTIVMNNIRTFASLAFDHLTAPEFPFVITPRLEVVLRGSGHGRVSGEHLDCGTKCIDDSISYQSKVTLSAKADPGSHFVRWEGVCSTDPICSFRSGSETRVGAVFDGPARPTAIATTATATATAKPTTSRPAATTTATVTMTAAAAFSPALQKVGMRRVAGRRVVVATLVVDRLAGATLQLSRRGRTIATTHWNLRAGRTLARLRVPKGLKPGRCQLLVRIVAGGTTRAFTTPVAIGR